MEFISMEYTSPSGYNRLTTSVQVTSGYTFRGQKALPDVCTKHPLEISKLLLGSRCIHAWRRKPVHYLEKVDD
jgi:hypothetical protein